MTIRDQISQDNRSFPRYQTKDSSALMLMPGNFVSYSLLDVSKSGLSFCYYGKSITSEAVDKAIVTFFADYVGSSDISVQVISDTELNNDNLRQPSPEKKNSKIPYLRRCGVKFNFVSEDQEDAINKYIEVLGTN